MHTEAWYDAHPDQRAERFTVCRKKVHAMEAQHLHPGDWGAISKEEFQDCGNAYNSKYKVAKKACKKYRAPLGSGHDFDEVECLNRYMSDGIN